MLEALTLKHKTMKSLLITLVSLGFLFNLQAQEPMKVVFDVTSKNTDIQEAAIRHLTIMSRDYKDSQFEMVVYSGALNMLLKSKSTIAQQVEALAKNDNVTIVACEMTMKRYNVTLDDMITGTGSVANGITEVVVKQQQGWSYIKEAQ